MLCRQHVSNIVKLFSEVVNYSITSLLQASLGGGIQNVTILLVQWLLHYIRTYTDLKKLQSFLVELSNSRKFTIMIDIEVLFTIR